MMELQWKRPGVGPVAGRSAHEAAIAAGERVRPASVVFDPALMPAALPAASAVAAIVVRSCLPRSQPGAGLMVWVGRSGRFRSIPSALCAMIGKIELLLHLTWFLTVVAFTFHLHFPSWTGLHAHRYAPDDLP
ncbi:hypothetical protein RC54_18675 [Herbaspirillum rubrisubalbicans]|uniref:Uncharacterized protein n=1 Tax=Herbaspirillum rubrisubalbicans TaxID=80842 RepID=A0AAD0UAA8_9BURK|nr:hypothetical protein RC54_18675 [Herbaspirillum rubrisubalbicans]